MFRFELTQDFAGNRIHFVNRVVRMAQRDDRVFLSSDGLGEQEQRQ